VALCWQRSSMPASSSGPKSSCAGSHQVYAPARSGHVRSVTQDSVEGDSDRPSALKAIRPRNEAAVKDADSGRHRGAARSVLDGRVSGGHDALGRRFLNSTHSIRGVRLTAGKSPRPQPLIAIAAHRGRLGRAASLHRKFCARLGLETKCARQLLTRDERCRCLDGPLRSRDASVPSCPER
jgi:hypothetical protein